MKLLVGYDGSNISKEAVKTAVKHAQGFNADIEVVTAISRGGELPYENIVGLEKKLAKEEKEVLNVLTCYPEHIDNISKKVPQDAGRLLAVLFELELKGMVKSRAVDPSFTV